MKKRGKLAYIREILYDYPILKGKNSLTPHEQQRIKIVENVLKEIRKLKNAEDILKLMDLVYFNKICKLCDAAYEIAICERTAYQYNKYLMTLMETELKLI